MTLSPRLLRSVPPMLVFLLATLVSTEGEVKVADLGLVKTRGEGPGLTLTGVFIGTPQDMAPEQWRATKAAQAPADVWALGAVLWFLLAGRSAILPGEWQVVAGRICNEPFPDIRDARPEVPEAVAALIGRATAADGTRSPRPSRRS